eukprot:433729-Pleurochrysis_carterae.AAC.1
MGTGGECGAFVASYGAAVRSREPCCAARSVFVVAFGALHLPHIVSIAYFPLPLHFPPFSLI